MAVPTPVCGAIVAPYPNGRGVRGATMALVLGLSVQSEVTTEVVRAVVMLIIAVSLGAAGQMCLKYGVNLLGQGASPVVVLKGIFTPYVFGGFVLYGVSSLFYLIALSRLQLSFAYPFVALSFVMVLVLCWLLLGESLPPLRIIGVGLIVIGVLTVAGSYRGAAESQAQPPPAVEQPQ